MLPERQRLGEEGPLLRRPPWRRLQDIATSITSRGPGMSRVAPREFWPSLVFYDAEEYLNPANRHS